MSTEDPELRTAEAAALAGVSVSTLYRYTRLGYIRFRTLPSGQRRYLRSQLREDLATAPTEPVQEQPE